MLFGRRIVAADCFHTPHHPSVPRARSRDSKPPNLAFIARSLGRRALFISRSSTGSSTPATSAGLCLELRLPLLQCHPRCLSFVIHIRINSNSVAEVFDASPAHVHLLWVLPAASDGVPRDRHSSIRLQHAVLLEESVCGLCSGRQRLDCGLVVTVGGCSPFLGTGHGTGEAHAQKTRDAAVRWRRRARVRV